MRWGVMRLSAAFQNVWEAGDSVEVTVVKVRIAKSLQKGVGGRS